MKPATRSLWHPRRAAPPEASDTHAGPPEASGTHAGVNPEAVEHMHISPYRSASTGDVQWAERNNLGVYTLTGRGEFLYYDPRTNVMYYLEYLGRIQ